MKLQAILATPFLLAASAAYLLTPNNKMSHLEPITLSQMVPEHFDEWVEEKIENNQVISPEQDAKVKAIYKETLNRVYINKSGERVMLAIAYTDDQRDNNGQQAHKPEICYPAQGFSILNTQRTVINTTYGSISTKQLVTQSGPRVEPVTYWIMVGHQATVTGKEEKVAQLKYGMKGIIADGLLFRVSTITEDTDAGFKAQAKFINALASSLSPENRVRLTGLN